VESLPDMSAFICSDTFPRMFWLFSDDDFEGVVDGRGQFSPCNMNTKWHSPIIIIIINYLPAKFPRLNVLPLASSTFVESMATAERGTGHFHNSMQEGHNLKNPVVHSLIAMQ